MQQKANLHNESGFVLIATLLVLLILLIIGVAALNTTSIELLISGNEKVHKRTFYQADGGTELGIRLTFENAMCLNSGGFQDPGSDLALGAITIPQADLDFALPGYTGTLTYLPNNPNVSPSTTITSSGILMASAGSSLQQVAGYEGLGKAAAAGGTHMQYDITAQHDGEIGSQSIVGVEWRLSTYLINSASAGDCKF